MYETDAQKRKRIREETERYIQEFLKSDEENLPHKETGSQNLPQPTPQFEMANTFQQPLDIRKIISAGKAGNFVSPQIQTPEFGKQRTREADPVLKGTAEGIAQPLTSLFGKEGEFANYWKTLQEGKTAESNVDLVKALLHTTFLPFTVPFGAATGAIRGAGAEPVAKGVEGVMNAPFEAVDILAKNTDFALNEIGIDPKKISANMGISPELDQKVAELTKELAGLYLLKKAHTGANALKNKGAVPYSGMKDLTGELPPDNHIVPPTPPKVEPPIEPQKETPLEKEVTPTKEPAPVERTPDKAVVTETTKTPAEIAEEAFRKGLEEEAKAKPKKQKPIAPPKQEPIPVEEPKAESQSIDLKMINYGEYVDTKTGQKYFESDLNNLVKSGKTINIFNKISGKGESEKWIKTETIEPPTQEVVEPIKPIVEENPVQPEPVAPEPPPTQEVAKGKEPWEMTKSEYLIEFKPAESDLNIRNKDGTISKLTYEEAYRRKLISKKNYDERFGGLTEKQAKQNVGLASHRNSVSKAISAGKPVPPEVLRDYPDLAPKPESPKFSTNEQNVIKKATGKKFEDLSTPEQEKIVKFKTESKDYAEFKSKMLPEIRGKKEVKPAEEPKPPTAEDVSEFTSEISKNLTRIDELKTKRDSFRGKGAKIDRAAYDDYIRKADIGLKNSVRKLIERLYPNEFTSKELDSLRNVSFHFMRGNTTIEDVVRSAVDMYKEQIIKGKELKSFVDDIAKKSAEEIKGFSADYSSIPQEYHQYLNKLNQEKGSIKIKEHNQKLKEQRAQYDEVLKEYGSEQGIYKEYKKQLAKSDGEPELAISKFGLEGEADKLLRDAIYKQDVIEIAKNPPDKPVKNKMSISGISGEVETTPIPKIIKANKDKVFDGIPLDVEGHSLNGIRYDAERQVRVASNSHVMVIIPDKTIERTRTVFSTGNETQQYPNWSNIIPIETLPEVKTDLAGLHAAVNGILKANKNFTKDEGVLATIRTPDYEKHFEPKLLDAAISSLRNAGVKEVTIKTESPTSVVVVFEDASGSGIKALVSGNRGDRAKSTILDVSKKPSPETKIVTKEMADKARAELKKNLGTLGAGIDPTLLKHVVVLGGYHLEKGVRTFAQFSKAMIEEYGEGARKYLKEAWKQIQAEHPQYFEKTKTPEMPKAEGEPQKGLLGIKNAEVEAKREAEGKSPIEKLYLGKDEEVFATAGKKIDEGTVNPTGILNRALNKEAITIEEEAVLAQDYKRTNDMLMNTIRTINEATAKGDTKLAEDLQSKRIDLEEKTNKLQIALSYGGTNASRTLSFRKIFIAEDYSIARMESRYKAITGAKEVPPDIKKKFEEHALKINEAEAKLAEYEKTLQEKQSRIAELEAKRAVNQMARTTRKATNQARIIELKTEFSDIMKNIRTKSMRISSSITPIPPDIIPDLISATRNLIEQGIVKSKDILDELTTQIGDIYTRRQIQDAISGYGKTIEMPQDEISVALRGAKGEMRLLSALEDVKGGNKPLRTGLQRDKMTEAARVLAKEVRTEMKKQGMFIESDTRSPEQKWKSALDAVKTRLQNQIKDIERQIETGEKSPKKGGLEYDAEANALKAQRDKLKEQYEATEFGQQDLINAARDRVQKRIDFYQKKIDESDFQRTKKEPKQEPFDQELFDKRVKLEKAKQEYWDGVRNEELKNRHWSDKLRNKLLIGRRAVILSGVTTLGKISSAALQRVATTPVEEIVGTALSYLPFIKDIAAKSARQGKINLSAEGKAISEAWQKDTFKEFMNVLKTGKSSLDVLYGESHSKATTKFEHYAEFFGRLHGALKYMPKKNEFTRSFTKRMAFAESHGENIRDPRVQARIGAEAFADAEQAIFMNENAVTRTHRQILGVMERSKSTPIKIASTIVRILLPIVRVPTNYIGETLAYAGGGAKAAWILRKGVKNLTPAQADMVMRLLKKQAIGAALLWIGYSNAENFGGYYAPNDKRKDTDVQQGRIRAFGVDLPKWLSHTPVLEVMQAGAAYKRFMDQNEKENRRRLPSDAQGRGTAAFKTAHGLLDQVPFFEEPASVVRATENIESLGGYVGNLTSSFFVPPVVRDYAKARDVNERGVPIKRKAKGFTESVQKDIPWMREMLKRKK